jgi:hypothetical protein
MTNKNEPGKDPDDLKKRLAISVASHAAVELLKSAIDLLRSS